MRRGTHIARKGARAIQQRRATFPARDLFKTERSSVFARISFKLAVQGNSSSPRRTQDSAHRSAVSAQKCAFHTPRSAAG